MKKYRVYGVMTASIVIGEYEADSKDAAIEMSGQDENANYYASLCHQCSSEIDLGDIYKEEAEEIIP